MPTPGFHAGADGNNRQTSSSGGTPQNAGIPFGMPVNQYGGGKHQDARKKQDEAIVNDPNPEEMPPLYKYTVDESRNPGAVAGHHADAGEPEVTSPDPK
jgi:hypothetical protein